MQKLCVHHTTLHICLHGVQLFATLCGNCKILNFPGQQGCQIRAAAVTLTYCWRMYTHRHVLWVSVLLNVFPVTQ